MDGSPFSILLFYLCILIQFNSIVTIIHEPERIQKKVIDVDIPLSVYDRAMTFISIGDAQILPELALNERCMLRPYT